MASRVKEPEIKNKDLRCVFLSCIPVFGFFGFLFMGKKTDRKQLTAMGRIYGWLSLVPFAVLMMARFLPWLIIQIFRNSIDLYWTLDEIAENASLFSAVCIFVVWIICCIHTLSQIGVYRQYLYIKEKSMPARNPLVHNRKWRKENLTWMRWSWIPFWGGLSLAFAGKQLQDKKILKYGVGFFVTAFVLGMLMYSEQVYWLFKYGEDFLLFAAAASCFLWILTVIMSFMVREDYLDAWAKCWERDVQQQPLLRDRKWCRENSRWKRWTYFPYVGGVGFILAGGKSGIRKHSLIGTAMCILNAATLVIRAVMSYNYNGEGIMMMYALELVLYVFGIFFGKQIRWETLKSRARALKGYRSEFERELDMLERVQRRSAEVPKQEEPEEVPDVPAVKELTPEPARTVDIHEKIDINRCTQMELTQLPGISIGQAKTAIEYRVANNGFKSVDELVEILQIKPHFAVQIFEKAAVSEPKVPVKKHTDSGAARRRIDL